MCLVSRPWQEKVAKNAPNFGRETENAHFSTIQSHNKIKQNLLVFRLWFSWFLVYCFKRLTPAKKRTSKSRNLSSGFLQRIELDFLSTSYRIESSLIGSSKGFHFPGRQHSSQILLSNSTSFAPNLCRPWFLVHLQKGTWKSNRCVRPEKSII